MRYVCDVSSRYRCGQPGHSCCAAEWCTSVSCGWPCFPLLAPQPEACLLYASPPPPPQTPCPTSPSAPRSFPSPGPQPRARQAHRLSEPQAQRNRRATAVATAAVWRPSVTSTPSGRRWAEVQMRGHSSLSGRTWVQCWWLLGWVKGRVGQATTGRNGGAAARMAHSCRVGGRWRPASSAAVHQCGGTGSGLRASWHQGALQTAGNTAAHGRTKRGTTRKRQAGRPRRSDSDAIIAAGTSAGTNTSVHLTHHLPLCRHHVATAC